MKKKKRCHSSQSDSFPLCYVKSRSSTVRARRRRGWGHHHRAPHKRPPHEAIVVEPFSFQLGLQLGFASLRELKSVLQIFFQTRSVRGTLHNVSELVTVSAKHDRVGRGDFGARRPCVGHSQNARTAVRAPGGIQVIIGKRYGNGSHAVFLPGNCRDLSTFQITLKDHG